MDRPVLPSLPFLTWKTCNTEKGAQNFKYKKLIVKAGA